MLTLNITIQILAKIYKWQKPFENWHSQTPIPAGSIWKIYGLMVTNLKHQKIILVFHNLKLTFAALLLRK